MKYNSLESCLIDLEKNGQLVRVHEEVDPMLEMAAVHLRVHEAQGPALLFENVKGSRFRSASNIFGTLERSRFIFRDTIRQVEQLIQLKSDPIQALKHPFRHFSAALAGLKAFPLKNPLSQPVKHDTIAVSDLPLIQHWPMDGGAFVTLPQVYTEDPEKPGILHANLGMYRIQLTGNDYQTNHEIGLHYQLHRGIGVHQSKSIAQGKPLQVSIFVGGPPAHTVAAVMPLPEGMSEMTFAGVLGGRRFRYTYVDGYCISTDADFVITGEVIPDLLMPEGPFGDHLGYYSLKHPFPVLKVHKVFARKNAIWPFTVVGRPPQEDTSFGALIHSITGSALQAEIPGLKEVHAVDAAGVHPLLLAIGSERYTPYAPSQQPAELLTIANHILGSGQLSLAKFLFIVADSQQTPSTHQLPEYFIYLLERINWNRDIHFHTQTSIDTLDYSGTGLNAGSKVVFAACGQPIRNLITQTPAHLSSISMIRSYQLVFPGVVAVEINRFVDYTIAAAEMNQLCKEMEQMNEDAPALLIVADDPRFLAAHINNFLWITFTRCNPSHDIYGVKSHQLYKHWGCEGPLIIDARIKPHHAPVLDKNEEVEKKIDRIFSKGGSLHGIV